MTVLPLFDPTLDGTNEQNEPPPPTPATTVKPGTPGTMLTENPHDKLVPVYTDAKVGELRYLSLTPRLHFMILKTNLIAGIERYQPGKSHVFCVR